jgi:hypothetical protein
MDYFIWWARRKRKSEKIPPLGPPNFSRKFLAANKEKWIDWFKDFGLLAAPLN